MKILAIVVLYHPDKESLKENIEHFIDAVDEVILWDNSPGVFL